MAAKASSIESLTPTLFRAEAKEYEWMQGKPPLKMLHKKRRAMLLVFDLG